MKTLIACAAFVLSAAIAGPALPQAFAGGRENKNPGSLRMALISMKCLYSDSGDAQANRKNVQANLDRHVYFIDQAAAHGAEFVGFPELSINGYHFSRDTTWLSLNGPEVKALAQQAARKGVYLSVGLAERDAEGKKWNTQVLIGPDGKIVGFHHKIWLTKEQGFTEAGAEHRVFPVKGFKMGIATCADGTNYLNLKALVDNGAQIIYGPHANTTGGTLAGWYRFRAAWGGAWDGRFVPAGKNSPDPVAQVPSGGWINQLKVYAALHNHAGLYHSEYNPPVATDKNTGFASGAWFIGPDGATLAQVPASTQKSDSKEYMLFCNVPVGKPPATNPAAAPSP